MEGPVESILIRGKKQHMLNIEEFSLGRVGKVDVSSVHSIPSSVLFQFPECREPRSYKTGYIRYVIHYRIIACLGESVGVDAFDHGTKNCSCCH
jgi:hypothetical protein